MVQATKPPSERVGAAMPLSEASTVVAFWREAGPAHWFRKDEAFDGRFRDRFMALHMQAARRALDAWAASGEGALALLILLDQFPRNAFRGTAHMYATDPLARHFARRMVEAGLDQQVEPELRLFCYLPFAHSEDLKDQHRSVSLQRALGPAALAHSQGHRNIIVRFGRFPHRNALLGRTTRPQEQAFLDEGGFAG